MKLTKTILKYICPACLLISCKGSGSSLCPEECVQQKRVVNNELSIWESSSTEPTDFASEPLVCSLMGAELAERKGALQKEIFSQVKGVEEIETGYIFSFKYDERFVMQMTDYVISENNCCPFFTFEMKLHAKNDVLLKITGAPEAKKMLETFLAG